MDQYFTTTKIVEWCLEKTRPWIKSDTTFIESSAGDGVFLPLLPGPYRAYDIEPMSPGIRKADFLKLELPYDPRCISIGNPPFGPRSSLAVDFVNRSALSCDIIAFILPPSFRRWEIQKQIDSSLALVFDEDIPSQVYRLPITSNKSDANIPKLSYHLKDGTLVKDHYRCYQIWVRGGSPNLRLQAKPPEAHPDFEMWTGRKVTKTFDFAVPQRGYVDFSVKAIHDRDIQGGPWMFFKAHTPKALKRLLVIDFVELAGYRLLDSSAPKGKRGYFIYGMAAGFKKGMVFDHPTPGFSKAEVVARYLTM